MYARIHVGLLHTLPSKGYRCKTSARQMTVTGACTIACTRRLGSRLACKLTTLNKVRSRDRASRGGGAASTSGAHGNAGTSSHHRGDFFQPTYFFSTQRNSRVHTTIPYSGQTPPDLNSLGILLHPRCGSSPDVLPEAATFVIADAAAVATRCTVTATVLLLLLLLPLLFCLLPWLQPSATAG